MDFDVDIPKLEFDLTSMSALAITPTTSHEDKQLLNKSGHFNYNTSSPRGGGNRSAARNQNRTR
ncbi:MAG: hypothetical protein KA419_12600, partial [Acidobacteria bacterium]|nr:hypothetical protein [Acidobacteriota bacterium]